MTYRCYNRIIAHYYFVHCATFITYYIGEYMSSKPSKWEKYGSMFTESESESKPKPFNMDNAFKKGLDIWANSQPNSILRVARVLRLIEEHRGGKMSFERSVALAGIIGKGKLR